MNLLVQAIKLLKPTAEFSFIDDDYSTVQWNLLDGDAPTLADISAAIEQVKLNQVENDLKNARTKAALLERLGITEDEAKLLLG